MIAALTGLIPVGGILISTAIATIVALTGSSEWIRTVRTIKLVGRPLANMARLGEYYRVHPPKPLLYYVFYPLLFPYWLVKKTARAEFLAYKRLGALALIITVVTAVHDYFHNWTPLPRHYFFGALVATTILQLLFTFMFVMPIVTTLITYKQAGHKKSLVVLLILGVALGGVAAYTMRKLEVTSLATQLRIRSRMKWQPTEARAVMRRALDAAIASPDHGVAAQSVARTTLEEVFRSDETRAFHLLHGDGIVILVAKTKNHEYAWVARSQKGIIERVSELPADVQRVFELDPTASAWP
jgi:hypothetical protein